MSPGRADGGRPPPAGCTARYRSSSRRSASRRVLDRPMHEAEDVLDRRVAGQLGQRRLQRRQLRLADVAVVVAGISQGHIEHVVGMSTLIESISASLEAAVQRHHARSGHQQLVGDSDQLPRIASRTRGWCSYPGPLAANRPRRCRSARPACRRPRSPSVRRPGRGGRSDSVGPSSSTSRASASTDWPKPTAF